MSTFNSVKLAPPIKIFQLGADCRNDTNPNKIALGVGAFRDENGSPWVLPVVREAEKIIANDDSLNKEYLPVTGLESFCKASVRLLLGDCLKDTNLTADGVQSISGTGGLSLAANFFLNFYHKKSETPIYISEQTWGNHKAIFTRLGFTNINTYRYFDSTKNALNIKNMLEDLQNADEKSIIVFHAVAHNPTGCDPSEDEWHQIAQLVKSRNLFPLMDVAYQGFASGNADTDAYSVRHFASQNIEFLASQSYSKNFGLYNERIGNLTICLKGEETVKNVKSQMVLIIRQIYSNPPSHGARIVSLILNDDEMRGKWQENLKTMTSRIHAMRALLKDRLDKLNGCKGTNYNWDHILTQTGMFSFSGLNQKQSIWMKEQKSIYMLDNGRMSMCGVTSSNVDYLAESMNEALSI